MEGFTQGTFWQFQFYPWIFHPLDEGRILPISLASSLAEYDGMEGIS
jgi:hypothetical protein